MSVVDAKPAPDQPKPWTIVNDFTLIAATVNGSGSQTANNVIVRSIFKMGIPVTGKNLFPSNIKGLPTWFLIRVSKDGYTARQDRGSILIAMNLNTAAEDVENVESGGVVLYPDDWRITFSREDLTYYPLPVKSILKDKDIPTRLKDYVENMVYVGAVAVLLGIPIKTIKDSISYYLGGKEKAIALNMGVVESAARWFEESAAKSDPFRVEPMDKTDGLIMIDGNAAGGMGAVFGGVSVIAWYPITPSTSLIDSAREYLALLRSDQQSGQATYAVVQAEDELAAIGMVLGAGWGGARSMTATSGPGISLMAEYAGFGYAAELPGVIWDVQRVGPSTGLPTRTSQADLTFTYFLGHGDSRHVVLLPGNMEECFEFGWRAFDLAEQLQTPVFVLSDLDLGMNQWMSKPFAYPDQPINRGKVLDARALGTMKTFARFVDADGDGVGYRTLPGTDHPLAAYFTRGTGHNEYAIYSERPEDYVKNTERLRRKHDTARTLVPKPLIDEVPDTDTAIVVFGSMGPAVDEARDLLRQKHHLNLSYMRVRALPFSSEVFEFVSRYKKLYVIENNIEGQLAQLLRIEIPKRAADFESIAYLDGLPFTANFVVDRVLGSELEGEGK